MRVVIIDYGSGNLRSCAKAFERAASEISGMEVMVSSAPETLREATHIVLPGVGAFADCKRGLEAVQGLRTSLEEAVLHHKQQFLGICVGMQLLFERGFEHGEHQGFGWLSGDVVKLAPAQANLKIPHMGWNELIIEKPSALFHGIEGGAHAYFVHSYHAKTSPDNVLASCDYGGAVVAVVGKENIHGVQFHPEKSQSTGLRLIGNFLAL